MLNNVSDVILKNLPAAGFCKRYHLAEIGYSARLLYCQTGLFGDHKRQFVAGNTKCGGESSTGNVSENRTLGAAGRRLRLERARLSFI